MKLRHLLLLAAMMLISRGVLHTARGADWPQWRGPDGQGHATARNLPLTWSESDHSNIEWRTSLPGKGWSSPVIDKHHIWMTAAKESEPTAEDLQELSQRENAQTLKVSGSVSLRALCVDRDSGELLHDIELLREDDPQAIHSLNSYASPSPILHEGKLYCHFGAHGSACVDVESATIVWTNDEIELEHENGPGSTPVLWNDRLIVHCDGTDVQYVVALDAKSGEEVWRTSRSGEMDANPQFKKAYGTPILIPLDGGTQLISPAADWVYGYDPADGRELWKVAYGELGFSIVPRPVAGNGFVYFSTSFMQPQLIALHVGDGTDEPYIAWRQPRQAPRMPSPLLVGEELYIVSDNGVASCLDGRTGEILWAERLGGNFSSSPLLADGNIYVGNRDGEMFVFRPGRRYELLAANRLDSGIMATPAAVEDSLFIRTEQSLYCVRRSESQ